MGQLKIAIEADTNDADYITNISDITVKQLEVIKPVIQAISDFEPYSAKSSSSGSDWSHSNNFPNGECAREDLGEKSATELYGHIPGFDEFMEFVPYGEYGIHTIESIEVYEISNIQKLL